MKVIKRLFRFGIFMADLAFVGLMMMLLAACAPSVQAAAPDTTTIAFQQLDQEQVQAVSPIALSPQPGQEQPQAVSPVALSPVAVTQACVDAASFVSDVTIPDNTILAANTAITKTWRVKNTGSCTWDSHYIVWFVSGTAMSQQPGYRILTEGQSIPPGQTADVSVGITTPVENGTYQSYWGLRREEGALIPVEGGANGNSFYMKFKVNDGSGTTSGNITGASIGIVLEQGSGEACTAGATYFVTAQISSDGPTTAYYEIGSSAGQIPAGNFDDGNGGAPIPYVTGTITFGQAETRNVALRLVGPYPYPDDIRVDLRVNGGDWHSARVVCQ